jgi:hypothetical protein
LSSETCGAVSAHSLRSGLATSAALGGAQVPGQDRAVLALILRDDWVVVAG